MQPNTIILDTKDSVLYLRSKINNLLEFNADEDKIMPLIFSTISDEVNAELELHYDCLAIVKDAIGEAYENDIDIIIDAIIKFGTLMLYELKQMRAYENGFLNYAYGGMLGKDIILVSSNRGVCYG
jgi:hypothetical protein